MCVFFWRLFCNIVEHSLPVITCIATIFIPFVIDRDNRRKRNNAKQYLNLLLADYLLPIYDRCSEYSRLKFGEYGSYNEVRKKILAAVDNKYKVESIDKFIYTFELDFDNYKDMIKTVKAVRLIKPDTLKEVLDEESAKKLFGTNKEIINKVIINVKCLIDKYDLQSYYSYCQYSQGEVS